MSVMSDHWRLSKTGTSLPLRKGTKPLGDFGLLHLPLSPPSKMEFMTLYAIVAGGIFLLLVLVRIAPSFEPLAEALSRWVAKHLAYPYLLGRHRLIGPWTRLAVFFPLRMELSIFSL